MATLKDFTLLKCCHQSFCPIVVIIPIIVVVVVVVLHYYCCSHYCYCNSKRTRLFEIFHLHIFLPPTFTHTHIDFIDLISNLSIQFKTFMIQRKHLCNVSTTSVLGIHGITSGKYVGNDKMLTSLLHEKLCLKGGIA